MPNRIYRIVLIVAAAVIFGLLLYWIAPDVTPYAGENGAALWSWFLIVASGIAAHWLLPKTNLSPVSHVLFALLAGAVVVMVIAWVFVLVVDFPVDQYGLPQVLIVGLSSLVFASIVFVPIHLIRRKLGRAVPFIYFLTGVLIPASYVMIWRPLGQEDFSANLLSAVLLSILGACSAAVFAIATTRLRNKSVAEP
ncbi:MAG: hypothetical protein ACR2Q3_09540 [Woeseiaceae bacterium]